MKIKFQFQKILLFGVCCIGLLIAVSFLNFTHAEGSFTNLNNYQKQKYWELMKNCQPMLAKKEYGPYRACALDALKKAEETNSKLSFCIDTDGIDYLKKGKVTSDLYPEGIEDYIYTFPNGKTYLIEGGCNTDKKYITYQKNCQDFGINYDAVNGICKIAIWKILETYPNLQKIKTTLEEIKIWDNAAGKYTISGKDLVKNLLENGYNGLSSNDEKEVYFKKQLAPYSIQYLAETNFIHQVVQSLWTEGNKMTPWSIVTYTPDQAHMLYPAFFEIQSIKGGKNLPKIPLYPSTEWSAISDTGAVTIEFLNDTLTKTYALSKKLTADAKDQKQAIAQITAWMEKNFMHANSKYGWDVYKKDNTPQKPYGPNIFIPKNLSRFFEERLGGCHEPAPLMRGMLVSLNIPAINFSLAGHGVVYLPTLNRYIHGDHIADFSVVPPESLLLTETEIAPLVSGIITDYDGIIRKKFPFPKHYFPNIEDDRDGNSMYLWTDSVSTDIPISDWKTMFDQALPEYTLKYDQAKSLIKSTLNKIQTLEELSK